MAETPAVAPPARIVDEDDEDDVEENDSKSRVRRANPEIIDAPARRTLEFASKEIEKKNEQLTFKIQETFDKFFIVFHIP